LLGPRSRELWRRRLVTVCEGKAGTQIVFERDGHTLFVRVGTERQDAPTLVPATHDTCESGPPR